MLIRSLKSLALVFIGLSTLPARARAAAEVTIHPETETLLISSHILFYGPSATESVAADSVAEINRLWNEVQGTVQMGQTTYRVEFAITHEVVTEAQARVRAWGNQSTRLNFVMVEENNRMNISYWTDLGTNSGSFVLKDKLGISTTTAHEYGHGLGLDHPSDTDIRGNGQPGVMFPRGSLVDPEYQWDPSAIAGQIGGTLNPSKRKVILQDIADLGLSRLNFFSGTASLGRVDNVIISPTVEQPLDLIEQLKLQPESELIDFRTGHEFRSVTGRAFHFGE